jgi:hypothetical protein
MTQKNLKYETNDFKITTNKDSHMPFSFTTKRNIKKPWISANFFWEKNNVHMRLIGQKIECQIIAYPFVNHNGNGILTDIKKTDLLNSLINRLNFLE